MKIVASLGNKLSRRALLQRLGVAAVLLPVAGKLGKEVRDCDKRRRRLKDLEDLENIWIGHC